MIQIGAADRVFVLTGAGISAESGVPTFRDSDGIWAKVRPEDVATPEAWELDPVRVWRFYSERRRQAHNVTPNPAHFTLAELERVLGVRLLICTQNVDPLHEKAGSQHVIHMHGELCKSRCERCSRPPFQDTATYFDGIPRCECGGRIRPHVCWFGEVPFQLDEVFEALDHCTIFLTVGSSGMVQPAARFPLWAGQKTPRGHARRYYIGVEEPDNSLLFDEVLIGKAGELLPGLFNLAK